MNTIFTKTEEILNKPSIKKHYGAKLNLSYPKELVEFEQEILIKNIDIIKSIWDTISIDVIYNNIDVLEIISLPITDKHIDWFRNNLKLDSFLNMLSSHYNKVGCIQHNSYIKDTFDQLEELLDRKIEIDTPKRWRLVEFHDHISYLYIRHSTVNKDLKTIIKPHTVNGYIISQPPDTVTITIWGKRVKNCIASYADRIGKSSWIFFIEKDGAAIYTVETDMSKEYNIKQIVTQCNGGVNSEGHSVAHDLILAAVNGKN